MRASKLFALLLGGAWTEQCLGLAVLPRLPIIVSAHRPGQCTRVQCKTGVGLAVGAWESFYDAKHLSGFGADYRAVLDERTGRKVLQTMGYEEIYGEVEASGLRRILDLIGPHISDRDEMWDLGSGVGKVVAQFSFETLAGSCNGLELGARRHKAALNAHAALVSAGHASAGRMHLINGDMLAAPCLWSDASIIYINAVWGPNNPLFQAVERILYNSCSRLRFLIVGGQELGGPFLTPEWERREIPCPITWQDDFQMLVYSRRGLL